MPAPDPADSSTDPSAAATAVLARPARPARPATPDRPAVVIGAGIAGVACARVLHDAGVPVRLLDRGRRIGGRMAARTESLPGGSHVVDIGASYFTVRDPRFADVVQGWQDAGLAREWTDTFHLVSPDGPLGTTTSIMRWSARHGLRALVEHLADGLDHTGAVEVAEVGVRDGLPCVDGAPAAAAVLAMPDPQAADLVSEDLATALGLDAGRDWSPTLALWAAWPRRWWPAIDGAFVQGSPILTWIADDGRRRGDDVPILVAHADAVFAAGRLDDPGAAAAPMLAELVSLLSGGVLPRVGVDVPEPLWTRVHRWSLAAPRAPHPHRFALTTDLVGACGDGWGPRPRIEQAWLSGHLLGQELLARLSG